ncbi:MULTISPECIES: hypothetical protein [unclassified Streptomyces]|uniref:DUF1573 domain-containing protein n=1 Tax=Streptomyces sp. NBC_00119 TaxID=2975659 RepID=A0AAU1UBE2_9ACTN|nr:MULTISPECIES: hypothetical protein [unclassified Streptomyces]MCX4645004.1 DUF1573 domain-containing protein [Streptomyces sp. NBC_01446]MCX5326226.1 DUF1573 domain-containing protein [Streptomyces sp. NBC_00120]
MNRRHRCGPRLWAAALVLVTALGLAALPLRAASAAEGPAVTLSKSQAGTGGSITVSGSGWRPKTLLMMLICGQSEPGRGVIGGTNSCANADGRAVTTGDKGTFSKKLPVAEPPVPCPCVVHVATVTGDKAQADAVLKVAGHPVRALPAQSGAGKLSVLSDTRLDGSSGVLTWFGAPASRTFVFTVGNVGSAPLKDPVFQVGTSHGVFAPQWEDQQWRGTIAPGRKAQIKLPVELASGAHGNYLVSLKFGGKVLAEQPWGVGRPWGVTLFWILLCVVVPGAVFRIGMAVVDRLRPRRSGGAGRHRGALHFPELAARRPKFHPRTARQPDDPTEAVTRTTTTTALPWFTPDTDPGAPAGQLSAPSDNSPTTKGNT